MASIKCTVASAMFAACALGAGSPAMAQSLTPSQTLVAENLVYQDFSTYLSGGKAEFDEVFSRLALPEVRDQDVAQQYLRNAIAADLAYKGKVAVVRGTFVGAENWMGDAYRVQLVGVVAEVPRESAEFLALVHQGQGVVLACEMEGKELDFVHMIGCESADSFKRSVTEQFVSYYLSPVGGTSKVAKELVVLVRAIDAMLPSDSACHQRAPSDGCASDLSALIANPAFEKEIAEMVEKGRPRQSARATKQ